MPRTRRYTTIQDITLQEARRLGEVRDEARPMPEEEVARQTTEEDADPFHGIDIIFPGGSGTGTDPFGSGQASAGTPTAHDESSGPRRSTRKGKGKAKATASDATAEPKHKRGLCTSKATAEIVARNGPIFLTWDDQHNIPLCPPKKKNELSWDIGAIIRAHVPITGGSYADLSNEDLMIVINRLSAYYRIDYTKPKLIAYINAAAAKIYREYKYDCNATFLEQGGEYPIPEEFIHKPTEWIELCAHFRTPEFQKKSDRMKAIRGSDKKKNHNAGPTPFSAKALDFEAAKHPAPYIAAYGDAYQKNDPDRVAQVMAATSLYVEERRPSTADDAESAFVLSMEDQIHLMEPVVGQSAGTRFRGFGNVEVREPKKRGPARDKAVFVDEEAREVNRQQAERLKAMEEQMAEQERRMADQAKLMAAQAKEMAENNRLFKEFMESQAGRR